MNKEILLKQLYRELIASQKYLTSLSKAVEKAEAKEDYNTESHDLLQWQEGYHAGLKFAIAKINI